MSFKSFWAPIFVILSASCTSALGAQACHDVYSVHEAWRSHRLDLLRALADVAKPLETFLESASILKVERDAKELEYLDGEVRSLRIVTLENGVKAIFRGKENGWKKEIASYVLSLELNLPIVPVTVERVIEGERGALQFFIPDSFNGMTVTDGRPKDWQIAAYGAADKRESYSNSFRLLIYDGDISGNNRMVDKHGYEFNVDFECAWCVGFATEDGSMITLRRAAENNRGKWVTINMYRALKNLSLEALGTNPKLKKYLDDSQIAEMWRRRNWLIEEYERRHPRIASPQ